MTYCVTVKSTRYRGTKHKWRQKNAQKSKNTWFFCAPLSHRCKGGKLGRGVIDRVIKGECREHSFFAAHYNLAVTSSYAPTLFLLSSWRGKIDFAKLFLYYNLKVLRWFRMHTWTEIRMNQTWVHLESTGALRTPSIRPYKRAPTLLRY